MIKENTEIIKKDDVDYNKITIIEVKEDGTEIIRGVVETPVQTEPVEPPLSDEQQTMYDTAINVEYLVCLADLGL